MANLYDNYPKQDISNEGLITENNIFHDKDANRTAINIINLCKESGIDTDNVNPVSENDNYLSQAVSINSLKSKTFIDNTPNNDVNNLIITRNDNIPLLYQNNLLIGFLAKNNNTDITTINLCNLGIKNVKKIEDDNIVDLEVGDIQKNQYINLLYLEDEDCFIKISSNNNNGNGLFVGFMGFSSLPFTEEEKKYMKIFNSQYISASLYPNFYNRLKQITTLYPNVCCTDAEYDTILSNSKLGQCGKFVINENLLLYGFGSVYTKSLEYGNTNVYDNNSNLLGQGELGAEYYKFGNSSNRYYTESLIDGEVDVYEKITQSGMDFFHKLGTGTLSNNVLTYDSLTYNRNPSGDIRKQLTYNSTTYNYDSTKNIQSTFIRLPKIVNFVGGTLDFTTLGDLQEEELPNFEGESGWIAGTSPTGVFSKKGSRRSLHNNNGNTTDYASNFDASQYSSTYKDGGKVKQEAVKGFYYIVVANGVEEEEDPTRSFVIDSYQPMLWEPKYSPLSYLSNHIKADSNFYERTLFPDLYDSALVEYNPNIAVGDTSTLPSGLIYRKQGLSVKLIIETYNDFDIVIDNTNETFRTPLKTLLASGNKVVGNGTVLGLNDGTNNLGLISGSGSNWLTASTGAYSKKSTDSYSGTTQVSTSKMLSITQEADKSGMELYDGDVNLFFYAYNEIKNPDIVNTEGLINEVQNIKNTYYKSICPDYANGQSVSVNFVAPSDGVLYFQTSGLSDNLISQLYVDGVLLYEKQSATQSAQGKELATGYCLIGKNQVITSTTRISTINFYPFKNQ